MIKFFRKYHKWLGVVLTLFLILFALSGIVLNHRKLFSSVHVSRKVLPKAYRFKNWNNASVKGVVNYNDNRVLVYGNVGVWQTDTLYSNFVDFNIGFPKGADNRKVNKVFKHRNNDLFAATLSGLHKYNADELRWETLNFPMDNEQIVDISSKGDTLLVLTRSHLFMSQNYSDFTLQTLPEPVDYDNKISLFKTLWVIHSGEILGVFGQIFVDALGVIFIFLSITGFIFFINRYRLKKCKKKNKPLDKIKKSSKWNLRWHNKIGWITLVFLIVLTLTGMFLRPPLLIAIVRSKVGKIPLTKLNTPNPWFDKLRAVRYNDANHTYIFSTSEGMYYADKDFSKFLQPYAVQPPVSVMGINVFENIAPETYLVGSFSGIFVWNLHSDSIINRISGKLYQPESNFGRPIGNEIIAGYIPNYKGREVFLDYSRGAITSSTDFSFVEMPSELSDTPMPLWNIALEIHTARMYRAFLGDFYILFIPLSGLLTLFILISGFVVWNKKHRKRKKKRKLSNNYITLKIKQNEKLDKRKRQF